MMLECEVLSRYNKSTESFRNNDVDNASTEFSLAENPSLLNKGSYHYPVVLFTNENICADKSVPVVNIPPERFIGCP